jgi:hypothetical protein
VIKHLLQYVPSPPSPTTAVLQGNKTTTMAEPEKTTEQPTKEVQQEEGLTMDNRMRQSACNILIEHVDPETLLLFAQAIEKNPDIINTLKKWL